MKLKNLAIVTLALLAIAAVGGWLTRRSGEAPSEGLVGQPLLQASGVAGVVQIRIDDGKTPLTLRSTPAGWEVVEQLGFPADEAMISRLLFELNDRRIGRKISNDPKVYRDLGLVTPEENGGKAEESHTGIAFTVADQKGQPLYRAVFGNRRAEEEGLAGKGGMYVRLFQPEDAAYLINSRVSVNTKPEDWIQSIVVNFDEKKDLQAFTIARPGKPPLRFSREKPESPWVLAGEPNAKLWDRALAEVTKGLGDVFMVKLIDPKADPATLGRAKLDLAEARLFDKRVYKMTAGEELTKEGYRVMTVHAELDPSVTDEKLRKTVETFNRKFDGRLIAVHDWMSNRFMVNRDYFNELADTKAAAAPTTR